MIEQELTRALGPIEAFTVVQGGDTNRAATFVCEGQKLFVKHNAHHLPGQFEAEAAGLRAMRAAETSLVVPEPIHVGEQFLVLTYLEPGPSPDPERLGRGLARLHQATDPRGFGFERDGTCGATPQRNPWTSDWPTFYTEHRLRPLLEKLGLPTDVLARAADVLEDDEPPALVHGDLWFGNLYGSAHGPALVDPAAYYGHREAELGMMFLFGGFPEAVYTAYEAVRPLRQGWRQRIPWYSLYHVLKHALLFPGGYRDQALRILARLRAG